VHDYSSLSDSFLVSLKLVWNQCISSVWTSWAAGDLTVRGHAALAFKELARRTVHKGRSFVCL